MSYLFDGLTKAIWLLFSGNAEVYSAVFTTLKISTLSIGLSLAIGLPLGFELGYFNFKGKKAIKTLVNTLLSMPTVVIGLVVYSFIFGQGPLAKFHLLFSIKAIVIGQTILALPIVIALTANVIENLDERLKFTILTLGASGKQIRNTVFYEARYALLSVAIVAYGRIVSEIGISMMVGGNIKWYTRTITTAIALETGKGEFAVGVALGVVLLLLSCIINVLVIMLNEKVSP